MIARKAAMSALAWLRFVMLVLIASATCAFAGSPDSIAQPEATAPKLAHTLAFEDVSARMGLGDIIALPTGKPGGFVAVGSDGIKPGFSRSAWWWRAVARNGGTAPASLVLALREPRLENVAFYLERGGRWEREQADSTSRYPLLRFTLAPGEQVGILIRETGDAALTLQPQLFSPAEYDTLDRRETLWCGALIGGFVALAWSALLIAYFSRSVAFLLLAALCSTTALYEASLRGYTKLYLWPHAAEWSARSVPIFGCVSVLLFLMFILNIARGEKTNVPARRILVAFAVLEGVCAAGSAFGDLHVFDQAALAVNVVLGITELGIAAVLSRRRTPTARLMLMTVGFGVFNFALHVAEALGVFAKDLAWLNSDIHPNPIVAAVGLATHLVVLAAWVDHVGRQRQAAREELVQWQSSEQERLRHEVAQRTLALNDALLDAQEKNRQKIETLGYVSHDLRAPLATIASYAKLLHSKADPRQSSLILAIERSVNYQLGLIDDLVGYAKAELRPLDIAPSETDLPALLNDIAEYSIALCGQLNNRFFYQALTSLPRWLTIDGRRLQQVLLNLLSNASKFTRDGVVMMTVRARREGAQWSIGFEVADTGIGMDIDGRSNLVSALRQMEAVNGTTGLGLVIAQRIVEMMGGELRVSSAPRQGTSFSFEIVAASVHGVNAKATETVPYSSLSAGVRPKRPSKQHDADAPPAEDRLVLAALAKDGRMTDIERWIDSMSEARPAYAAFLADLRSRLDALDFTGIETLAGGDRRAVEIGV
ncbi:sensor histidine kinase [Trinickia sp. NRRL B-1857]|uniref:sensor histidine kinase n=1 Tax=Trinickia sp. NRRL B-1857 TaxID=3162879 RepID=UPI003D2896A3